MSRADGILRALGERGETLGFCESLTAGLACATVADVPGASAVLRGALVTYATDLKGSLALVDAAVLAQHGPVAPETAEGMAEGARERLGCDWAVSLTGVAGPEPQDGHPVGEVHLGLAHAGEPTRTRRVDLDGSRAQIRAAAVDAALGFLAEALAL
ncbi:CinA family protein [Corynebacterium frankenforstense]